MCIWLEQCLILSLSKCSLTKTRPFLTSGTVRRRESQQLRNLIYSCLYQVKSSFHSHYFIETALEKWLLIFSSCGLSLPHAAWLSQMAAGYSCFFALWMVCGLLPLSLAIPAPPTSQAFPPPQSCPLDLSSLSDIFSIRNLSSLYGSTFRFIQKTPKSLALFLKSHLISSLHFQLFRNLLILCGFLQMSAPKMKLSRLSPKLALLLNFPSTQCS